MEDKMRYTNYLEARELYVAAKDAYYNNIETIIDDKEFDELEEWLKENDPDFKSFVGAPSKENKFEHWSPMLSLEKIQIKPDLEDKGISDILLLTDKIREWKDKLEISDVEFEITPKFDGVSVNIQYENGKLLKAITRGDKVKGRDITDKIINIIPKEISLEGSIEIRGEILMPISIFEFKYSKNFKNPRNIVAGMLSQKDPDFDFSDLRIVPFEIRKYENGNTIHFDSTYIFDFLSKIKEFSLYVPFYIIQYSRLENFGEVYRIWSSMTEGRKVCQFQLDGFVIKCKMAEHKNKLKESDTHPKWAIAIKFLPKVQTTKILDIDWRLGKTGEFTPVAILEPIDLDGSMVSHASLHNYATIKKLGTSIGAEVSVEKKGDIIPQITEVINKSEAVFNYPKICPYCGTETIVEDEIRVKCSNEDCPEINTLKFISGLMRLEYDYLGDKNARKLYETGLFSDIFDVFDRSIMTVEKLVNSGKFSDGKIVRKIVEDFSRKRDLDITTIIRLMDIDRIGSKTAFMLSEHFSGNEADFKGLEKELISSFIEGELNLKYKEICEKLTRLGINIILNEKIEVKEMKTFEMTGSPKNAGWKVKNDFIQDALSGGFRHSGLNSETTLLITDSYTSKSSKMSKAMKLGVDIKTYEDFKKEYL